MSLTRLACIILVTGVSLWIAGILLASRPAHRTAVQVAMIIGALLLIVLGSLHGIHFRSR